MTTVEPTTTTSTTSTSSTSPVAVAAAPVVNIKDKNIFGTLEVKIKEVKGCQTHFLLAKCELAQKKSEVKTKSLSNHTFVDVFEFRVSSPNSEIEIEAWKKNLFFKDKITGKLTLSINDLLTANGEPKWMPLASNKKARRPRTGAAAGGNPSSPSSPDSDSSASKPADENAKENDVARGDTNSEGEKDTEEESPKSRARSVSLSAKKPKDPPEILLEIKFTKNEPPKEVLKGIILDGVWTADNSVGTLTNNPHWIKCAQYLLTIKNETSPITIKLRQPEGVDQRISFFVINYDSFYAGSKKVIFDSVNDVKKVDDFFCPIAATSIDCPIKMEVGQFLIIPYAETFGYQGTYKLNVDSASALDNVELYALPKAGEDKQWHEIKVEGLWTSATNGGGDINTLHWTKNPQYLFTLTKAARACVLLSQDDHEKSIGFYVVPLVDKAKKIVEFRGPVGKTEAFKHTCHNGCTMNLEAGEYVVIPSTFDQAIEAAFHLTLFTDDRQATFAPLTDAWKHQELIKGTWVGKSAGGSPNSGESFFKNPQFRLTLPKDRAADTTVLVQLIQDSTLADEGIGFIVINRDQHDKALTAGDFQNEQLFTKTANWERRNDIAHRVVVKQDDPSVFTIIPSTYEKGVNRSFRVQVFSDLPVELDSIDEADDSSDEEEDNNSDKEEKDDNKKQDEN